MKRIYEKSVQIFRKFQRVFPDRRQISGSLAVTFGGSSNALPAETSTYQMPPKVAAPAAPSVVKNFQLELKLTGVECEGLRVRLFSEWLNCCGVTGFFGQGEQLWEAIADSEHKVSKYQTSFEAILNDAASLNAFNSKPAIYAVLLKDVVDKELIVAVPIGFTAIDCSPLAMESIKTLDSQVIVEGIQLDFKVTVENPLIPPATVIGYEPVLFDIKWYVWSSFL